MEPIMMFNIIDISIEGIKLFILLIMILIIILLNKKVSKKSNVEKKNFLLKGVLIWTLAYLIFSIIFIIGSSLVISMAGVLPKIGSLILVRFIPSLLIGLFSGWLIISLFLKKIKNPIYIGATIGFLIFLLNGFIPGFIFVSGLIWKIFGVDFFEGEFILAMISVLLVLIIFGGIIGFIVNKLKDKNGKK